jgi:hypothetical protein
MAIRKLIRAERLQEQMLAMLEWASERPNRWYNIGKLEPMLRLAGLIKGIYNTLDREHTNAEYVHDVRMKLVPVVVCAPNLTGYRLETPAAKTAPQAAAFASKIETPVVLKREAAHV